MKNLIKLPTVLVALMALAITFDHAVAQDRLPYPDERIEGLRKADRDISRAALATQAGQKLVSELQMLRNSEASMGKKHPTLPETKRRIKSVRRKLIALERDEDQKAQVEIETLARRLDEMSDSDLRLLVSQLIRDVRFLRERLIKLERTVQSPPQQGD